MGQEQKRPPLNTACILRRKSLLVSANISLAIIPTTTIHCATKSLRILIPKIRRQINSRFWRFVTPFSAAILPPLAPADQHRLHSWEAHAPPMCFTVLATEEGETGWSRMD